MIEKQELIELIQKLVQIESPYYKEAAAMEFCYQWLQNAGFEPERHYYKEEKAIGFEGQNLICKFGSGDGPKICLNGHLDTVPLCQGWTKPRMKVLWKAIACTVWEHWI